MQEARQEFSLVKFGEIVYAIGGSDGSSNHSSIEKYDGNRWMITAFLETGLKAHEALVLPDGIYIIGGIDNQGFYISDITKFDPILNTFTALPQMNTPRASFKAVLSQNCQYIYVIGG